MTSANRIHHLLYRGAKGLTDPGSGGIITPSADLQICEMVSAGAEARTLSTPTKAGIRFVLRAMTPVGAITVTTANGFNIAGETTATFTEASDLLSLISVTTSAGVFRWEILEGNVAVVVTSFTPSFTPSATVSHTPSNTPSATVSHTPSQTPSKTPSATPSATVSHTPSQTPSRTPSNTASNTISPSAT